MLILSRKQNETIVIDGQIELEVLRIKGNTVRIGIKAPRSVKVLRGELAPFERDLPLNDLVAESSAEYENEQLDRLPNPFAVAHAS